VLEIPISLPYIESSVIFAIANPLPLKSTIILSLALELYPLNVILFAELEAIVTLPETVTSTPPTETA